MFRPTTVIVKMFQSNLSQYDMMEQLLPNFIWQFSKEKYLFKCEIREGLATVFIHVCRNIRTGREFSTRKYLPMKRIQTHNFERKKSTWLYSYAFFPGKKSVYEGSSAKIIFLNQELWFVHYFTSDENLGLLKIQTLYLSI